MYHANESRYETMKYHRCGDSGHVAGALWKLGQPQVPDCQP